MGATAALIAALVGPAGAQELYLQTELDLRMTEVKYQDGATASSTRLGPRAQLTWRGPLRSGMNVYVDLGATGSLISEPGIQSDQEDVQASLHAQGEALSIDVGVTHSSESETINQPDGSRDSTSSQSSTFSVNTALWYPAYPLVSAQYQRATTTTGDGTRLQATSSMIGANYNWGPFRFSADDTRQDGGTDGSSFHSRQYGLNFSSSLTGAAQLSADSYFWTSEQGQASATRVTSRSTTVRLSAQPTPFLVLDGELVAVNTSQEGLSGTQDTSSFGHTVTLRTDPLPGMRVDLTERRHSTRTATFETSSQEWTANVALRLARETSLIAIMSQSRFSTPASPVASRQEQQQVAFTMPVIGRVNLQAQYNSSSQVYPESRFSSTSASLGVFGEVSPAVTTTVTYRRDVQDASSSEGAARDEAQSWQVEGTWSPDELWDLTAGVNMVRTSGTRSGSTVAPIVEARWSMDPATTLIVRYNQQWVRDESTGGNGAPVFFAGTASSFTGSLVHEMTDNERLELRADYRSALSGLVRWQRGLELVWTKVF